MRTALLVTLAIVSISFNLKAQDSWSLNDCIHYAIEHNLSYKNYELEEKNQRLSALQSKLDLLPSVSASSSGGINYGRNVDPTTNNITETQFFRVGGNLSAYINIFEGFTNINRIAYRKFKLHSAEWEKVKYCDDLAFNILLLYYDVIFYTGMVEIAEDQMEISEFNLRKTQAQVETGLKAKTDLLQMQATLESEKLGVILAKNKLEEVNLALQSKMNLELVNVNDFNLSSDNQIDIQPSLIQGDSLFYRFTEFSPSIKSSEAELLAANKNVAIARGQYLPSLYMSASVSTSYSENSVDVNGDIIPFNDQANNNLGKYVGASVLIPIFSKNQQRTRVNQAKIDREMAKNNLENRKNALYFQIMDDTRSLNALYNQYIQTEKQVTADEVSYNVALKKYNEGLINVIELLTEKEQLADSKSQLLLSRIRWEIKNKTMHFYAGQRFWN